MLYFRFRGFNMDTEFLVLNEFSHSVEKFKNVVRKKLHIQLKLLSNFESLFEKKNFIAEKSIFNILFFFRFTITTSQCFL